MSEQPCASCANLQARLDRATAVVDQLLTECQVIRKTQIHMLYSNQIKQKWHAPEIEATDRAWHNVNRLWAEVCESGGGGRTTGADVSVDERQPYDPTLK